MRFSYIFRYFFSVSFCLLSVFSATALADIENRIDPEKATGFIQSRPSSQKLMGKKQMLVAANPLAAQLGYDILQRGGTAIDAAIAVQAALTLVEPQSSGIGGGAFILYWDAANKKLTSFDAREVAPANATSKLFFEHGKVLPWKQAIIGGNSVGVPSVLKGLESAHRQYGKLPWGDLFTGAADLAEQGFAVSERMAKLLAYRMHGGLYQLEPAASYFYPKGKALAAGTWLKNPELADSLRMIGAEGADYFYDGPLSKSIVKAVQESAIHPGILSLNDLKSYRAREREPVCHQYHQYRLCGMGPPSSGGHDGTANVCLIRTF